jgi:small basic protein
MASDIRLLELASGIKDSLVKSGFLTVASILASSIADLSSKVGVDLYIAQIILEAARKFGTAAPVANL